MYPVVFALNTALYILYVCLRAHKEEKLLGCLSIDTNSQRVTLSARYRTNRVGVEGP